MADATTGNPIPTPLPAPTGGGSVAGPNLTGGQDWGSLLSGIYSLITGLQGKDINQAKDAALLADPFMNQRAQYQDKLNALEKDPSSYLKDPMFTAPLKLGGESLARQFGAAGMGNSGNVNAALQDYGQSKGNEYLQQQLQELNLLSGASVGSPAAAGAILQRGQQNQTNAIGSGIGGVSGLIPLILSGLGLGNGAPASVISAITKALGGGSAGGLGIDNSGAPPTGIVPGNTPGANFGPTDTSNLPDIVPDNPLDPNYVPSEDPSVLTPWFDQGGQGSFDDEIASLFTP